MNGIRDLVTTCTEDTIRGGRCTVEDIVRVVYQRYGQAVSDHGEYLAHQAIARIARESLRRMSEGDEDGEQLSLPGINLPAAIAVRNGDDETIYVDTHVATWHDLQAGEAERERNVEAAQAKLDEYRQSMRTLRPYMEGTAKTVTEAVREHSEAA